MGKAKKINTIDLFAGCGGLMEGFEANNNYKTLACVEWEKAPCNNLRKRLREKWGYTNADEMVLQFDMQRTDELVRGWNDPIYGSSQGLDGIIGENEIDLIIGGPPCQAYSVAGRIRDENGMNDDYRNFLFESYLSLVKHYKPKAFIFENVPGILSAQPNGISIIDEIKNKFTEAGYEMLSDIKDAVIDLTEYGVPQKRKMVIILGLRKSFYGDKTKEYIENFYYSALPMQTVDNKITVRKAIGDLPKLFPLDKNITIGRSKYSHSFPTPMVHNHLPRWQSERDIKIFKLLAEDIENKTFEYVSVHKLKELYYQQTGKNSNVHKYYVIRWDEQSNTIPAHLYKDGLRHIHPDSEQQRTLTVREAARLQTFDDDYEFIGNQTDMYRMIGNAVPPRFSKVLADAILQLL